ncbi:MAG: hypothetical protein KF680_10265 [Cryobacterium sp.]|nr:hypothetical protein [Cryobacterium sp.]
MDQNTRTAPSPTTGMLPRADLIPRVDEVLSARLTLIVAPPGFGKSELLTQWTAALDGRADVIRLDLDFRHNDPELFRAALAAASSPHLPSHEDSGERVAPIDLTGFVAAVEARGASDAPLVFMLDNLEHVVDSIIIDVLTAALRLLPASASLVIASRVSPNLLLGELRTRGEVVEISARDLAFSASEIDELAKAHGTTGMLEEVVAATGGWPAATALLLRSRRRARSALAEYFNEVVLAGLPTDERVFLEESSVLPLVTARDTERIFDGSVDSASMLIRLDRSGRFPLTREAPDAWSIPSVLREHLRERLASRDLARYRTLLGAAAELMSERAALSTREREVLALLDSELTAAAIAGVLGISYHTAKTHIRSIYDKLGVSTRVLALQRARERGLLSA